MRRDALKVAESNELLVDEADDDAMMSITMRAAADTSVAADMCNVMTSDGKPRLLIE